MNIAVTSKAFSKNQVLINKLKEITPNIKLNLTGKKLEEKELIEFLKNSDGVIVALEEINQKVIDSLPNLKIVSKFGVGLDNIDIEYCKSKNIHFGWTAGINSFSVAEQTLGFMLMLIRNLYFTSNRLSKGIWDKRGGFSLYEKTIGIIGVGHIGKELIKLLKPFNCKIFVNDIIEQNKFYQDNNLIPVSKEELFKQSDIVTIHTPLTNDTKNLINKNSLKMMKKNSFVINTSRGEIINLTDLKQALLNKTIAGAAIDVYDQEPPKDLELLELENLICTPHIGGNSNEATLAMGRSAIKHIKDFYDKK